MNSTLETIRRRKRLAECLALALALACPFAACAATPETTASFPLNGTPRSPNALPWKAMPPVIGASQPSPSGATTYVPTNCDDSGPGSLREAATLAVRGDVIDLSELGCSRITLTSGEIAVNSVVIIGAGADALTIDTLGTSRILKHTDDATLTIIGTTLKNAKYIGPSGKGGCVYSISTVSLREAVVTGCQVLAPESTPALGGAIYARWYAILDDSVVSGNIATAPSARAAGGGIYAGAGVWAGYSTISDNSASSNVFGDGGGVFVSGGVPTPSGITASFIGSTFSGNYASHFNGGFSVHSSYGNSEFWMINSTVSGNRAGEIQGGGGVYTRPGVYNSTIAFNQAAWSDFAVGLYFQPSVELQSSIFSNNAADDGVSYDVQAYTHTITGAGNLIRHTSSLVPDDTITDCPQLGFLANNGGPTLTHAIGSDSPAIDAGNILFSFDNDQRGPGFPRVFGSSADIGAFENQGDPEDFVFRGGFNSDCD
jgi:hypothetical protein